MTGSAIAVVVVAVPATLFGVLLLSALLEARLVAPDERAEKVREALATPREPDEVEQLVTGLAEEAMPAFRVRERSPADVRERLRTA